MRPGFVCATLAFMCACGRIGFDATATRGDAGPSGDIGGDGGAQAPCNSIDRFADDFDDGVVAVADWVYRYADVGTSYAEQGGDLVLTLAPNATGPIYAGYQSTHTFDLREARMVAQYSQLPSANTIMGLSAGIGPQTNVSISVNNGRIEASKAVIGAFTSFGSIPFDSAMQFWALSERGGRIYFETSPDNVTFTSFADVAEPFVVSSVRAHLYAGTEQPVASPGAARWAAFNPGKVHVAGCPVAMLTDNFDDGLRGDWDETIDACCTLQETGGALQFTTDGTSGHAVRVSRAGYDLRDGSVTVRVAGGPSMTSAFNARLFVARTDQDEIDLRIGGTAVTARTVVGGTPNNVGVARTGNEQYLRIRETAGTLYFETSPDKAAWSLVYTLATPFAVDDIEIRLQGSDTTTTADSFSFDDLDL